MCGLHLDRTIFFFRKGLVNDFTAKSWCKKQKRVRCVKIGIDGFAGKEDKIHFNAA